LSWQDILKETIAQNRVKEIEDIDIDIEDDDCNRKLQQMANKLKNYNLLLEERWKAGWPRNAEYFEIIEDNNPAVNKKNFSLSQKKLNKQFSEFFESAKFLYNPVPEPVACKALEILKSHQRNESAVGDTYKIYDFEHDGVDWEIMRSFNFDYQYNINELIIAEKGKPFSIILSWSNGEFFTGIYDENDNKIDTMGIYKYSGYYDAREFGFSWHE
tara:strand:- start:2030 stop:2674 length:645 start_codon:yes stop_codon:yes gene_type:complete